jgi:hemerythrin-like domain-containing protein
MQPRVEFAGFESLDACHRLIHQNLTALGAMTQHLEAHGLDAEVQKQAAAIETFFSSTARQHHADEEKNVFPLLLSSGNEELVNAARALQQDHGWIEENWIELAPQLRAIADGNLWTDPAEFLHCAQVFGDLCLDHITREETVAYPESKAYLAKAQEERKRRVGA